MRHDQRHVCIGFVAERALALQAAVCPRHLTMVGGENNDSVPPHIHLVQDVHDLLESAVLIPYGMR
jgi:hypothetical protein